MKLFSIIALLAASLSSTISDSPFDQPATFTVTDALTAHTADDDDATSTPDRDSATPPRTDVDVTVIDASSGQPVDDCDVKDDYTNKTWRTDKGGNPAATINGQRVRLADVLRDAAENNFVDGRLVATCGLRPVSVNYTITRGSINTATLPVVTVGSLFGSADLSS